jgi:phosphohistidine phosphatase
MCSLILLRHAKSSWEDLTLRDFDRPLNSRGCTDVKKIGKRLLECDLIPNVIVSSSSIRTKQTIEILKSVIGKDIITHFTSDLYHANPNVIMQHFLDFYSPNISIMIVGHNPGIQLLFENLSGIDIPNYPTCSFSFFKYNKEKQFVLVNFESPKKILFNS